METEQFEKLYHALSGCCLFTIFIFAVLLFILIFKISDYVDKDNDRKSMDLKKDIKRYCDEWLNGK